VLNKKRVYCITAVLILSMLSTTVLAAVAQTNESTNSFESRPPPYPVDNIVDPVADNIKEFRAQGLADEQIVQKLEKVGMYWDPETGASWVGTFMTDDQMGGPRPNPYTREETASELSQTGGMSTRANYQADAVMNSTAVYQGGGVYMSCGTVAISSYNSIQHVVTMHMGSNGCWVEIGVVNNAGAGRRFFTYAGNTLDGNGGWVYHGSVSDINYQNAFTIQLTGNYDSRWGYQYKCYLNNVAVRTGYITGYNNNIDFSNEAWSDTGSFTIDSTPAHFVLPYLYQASSSTWYSWGTSIGIRNIYATPPQAYSLSLSSGSYVFDSATVV